jgi:hypothetical protein
MSTTHLNPQAIVDLQPAHALWQRYTPEAAPYRFQAQTVAEAQTWQQTTRAALRQTLGFADLPPASLDPQLLETVDKGAYVREKWLLRTSAYT